MSIAMFDDDQTAYAAGDALRLNAMVNERRGHVAAAKR